MANRSATGVKRYTEGRADTRTSSSNSDSHTTRPGGALCAERFRRTRERALRLNELIEQCRRSGMAAETHPEVTRIRHELATDCPDAATPLLERQEAIELELLRTMERWYGSYSLDALSRLIAKTLQIRDPLATNAIGRMVQDPTSQKLLLEYARVNDKIIDILAHEGV